MSTPNFDTICTLCDVLAEFSWVYEFKVTQFFIEQVWKNFSSEVSNEQTVLCVVIIVLSLLYIRFHCRCIFGLLTVEFFYAELDS